MGCGCGRILLRSKSECCFHGFLGFRRRGSFSLTRVLSALWDSSNLRGACARLSMCWTFCWSLKSCLL